MLETSAIFDLEQSANEPRNWVVTCIRRKSDIGWALLVLILLIPARAFTAATENLEVSASSAIPIIQSDMLADRISSQQLVDYFIARINAVDHSGPMLRSVVEINPDAVETATRLDKERRIQGVRGPLHGVPVLVKDNIDTADRMLTTAGSLALVDSRPAKDAFIVSRLRKAGAVILGKTNLSEWANFRSTRSSSGWSARGGQTRNPYSSDRNPCGSSSGSGAAIAAGLAVAAVGTETDGSIVCPASVNGLVGIKPTIGLVSRSGVIPIAQSQDTAGPMTRTVTDAAVLLSVLACVDPADSSTTRISRKAEDYAKALRADGLVGARIGVARSLAGFHEAVDAVFDQAIAALRRAGAVIVDPANLELPKTLGDDEHTVLLYEFKDGINSYLKGRASGPKTLADLIAFNEKERDRELAYFGQELFARAQEKGPLTDEAYTQARTRGTEGARRSIDELLKRHKLDAIIAPTTGPAWTTDLVNGDNYSGGSVSQAPAIAGYPHITVPMGEVHELPVGLSFIGTAWSEGTLIKFAYAFEQATKARKSPRL